jgi:putative FmdB family regulatory protein
MIYSYTCPSCDKVVDRTVSVAARDEQSCDCGTELVRRFIPEGLRVLIPARFHTNEEDMRAFVDPDPVE